MYRQTIKANQPHLNTLKKHQAIHNVTSSSKRKIINSTALNTNNVCKQRIFIRDKQYNAQKASANLQRSLHIHNDHSIYCQSEATADKQQHFILPWFLGETPLVYISRHCWLQDDYGDDFIIHKSAIHTEKTGGAFVSCFF